MTTTYQHYQIVITATKENRYASISTLSLFDENGVDLCRQDGVQITADKQYSSQQAEYMIDGIGKTYWEGGASAGEFPMTIVVSLPAAAAVNKIFIENNSGYEKETITAFTFSGGNNINEWTHLKDFNNKDSTTSQYYYVVQYKVGGISLQDDGKASRLVIVNDWQTGDFLGKVVPDTTGKWQFLINEQKILLVTHIGEDGFAPQADGGITPIRA